MIPDIRRVGQHATLYATARNEQIIDFIIDHTGEGWQYNIESYGGIHRFVFQGPKGELTANAHLIASVAENPPTLLWRWSGQAQEGNTAGLNVSNAAEAMRKWGNNKIYLALLIRRFHISRARMLLLRLRGTLAMPRLRFLAHRPFSCTSPSIRAAHSQPSCWMGLAFLYQR
ncbi:DUF6882 domain-containing protein [Corynebacterium evansiae]|uniref:DUF6882 domain-containing protein n=1 Tax=Corynebacterium evansiae TaxID=2913499 RepID=UPI003B84B66C